MTVFSTDQGDADIDRCPCTLPPPTFITVSVVKFSGAGRGSQHMRIRSPIACVLDSLPDVSSLQHDSNVRHHILHTSTIGTKTPTLLVPNPGFTHDSHPTLHSPRTSRGTALS